MTWAFCEVVFLSLAGKIDKISLAKAMEDGTPENRYLLDRQTGQISLLSSKTMSTSELLSYKDRMTREPHRYAAVSKTPSEEKYHDMELFVGQVKDRKLQERLLSILRGGNPVRPFLDSVDAHPEGHEQWKKFKQQRVQKRIDDFLKENGLF